jgi:hypothetical protein
MVVICTILVYTLEAICTGFSALAARLEELLDQLSNHQLPKKIFASRIYFCIYDLLKHAVRKSSQSKQDQTNI